MPSERRVTAEEFLGCTVVRVEDFFNPAGYPRLPADYKGPTCEFCGRPVRDPEPWHLIGVNGGVIQISSIDDDDKMKVDAGYVGAWPIGRECARKVRQGVSALGLDPDKYVFRMKVPVAPVESA